MSAAYGITVLPENDPYVKLAEEAVQTMVYASLPGRFLVVSVRVPAPIESDSHRIPSRR